MRLAGEMKGDARSNECAQKRVVFYSHTSVVAVGETVGVGVDETVGVTVGERVGFDLCYITW